jgi:hypothetical protein
MLWLGNGTLASVCRKREIMRTCFWCAVIVSSFCSIASASFVNGDFSAGNTGFQSQYVFATFNGTEGEYTVRSDPQNWNNSFAPTADHTSGDGPMLIVNGATSGNPYFWQQTLAVLPAVEYEFTVWVASAVPNGPADLIVEINGAPIGSSFQAPLITGAWEPMSRTWNSGANNEATIRLINSNLSVYPNDFYVNDISFVTVPEPSTLTIITGLALLMCKRRSLFSLGR